MVWSAKEEWETRLGPLITIADSTLKRDNDAVTASPRPSRLTTRAPAFTGKLAPDSAILVRLAAGPPADAPPESDAKVAFAESVGKSARAVAVKIFVIPPYREPAEPTGTPVPMENVEKGRLVKHAIMDHGVDLAGGEWMRSNDANKPKIADSRYYGWHITGPKIADDVPGAAKALWVRPHHETVYKLDGSGYVAFAATVGVSKLNDNPQLHRDARVVFEIHADGKMVANSGVMTVGDKPRRLVATGLDKAKELKLVTRLDSLKDSPRSLFFWAEPTFYKK